MTGLSDLTFVIEIEEQGVRKLYGPVDTLIEARAVADLWVKDNQVSPPVSIRYMFSIPTRYKSVTNSPINPNQTTVDEQIRNAEAYAEDYIDPATVR